MHDDLATAVAPCVVVAGSIIEDPQANSPRVTPTPLSRHRPTSEWPRVAVQVPRTPTVAHIDAGLDLRHPPGLVVYPGSLRPRGPFECGVVLPAPGHQSGQVHLRFVTTTEPNRSRRPARTHRA